MNEFERLFLHFKWEVERYEKVGVQHRDFLLMKRKLSEAEEYYKKFKSKSGILNVLKGG